MGADRGAPHRPPPDGAGAVAGAGLFAAHARPPLSSADASAVTLADAEAPVDLADGVADTGDYDTGDYVVEPRVSPAHRAVPPVGGVRAGAAVLIALGMGLTALVIGLGQAGPTGPATTAAPAVSAEPVPVATASVPAAQPATGGAVRATAVHLPAVGVRSALVELDVGRDGALQVPADPAVAGWFVRGSAPGEPGPTVIAGHVDSRSGPGVFFRLDELAVGDRVEVTRSDGRVVAHRVVTVERHPKDAFPTARVYGPTPAPELRLVTCGGDFDPRSRHYRDNVIVTAVAAP